MSSKGRMMGLCWECERTSCICGYGSDDSVSLCSEDDVPREQEEGGANLSLISEPPCATSAASGSEATPSQTQPAFNSDSHQLWEGQSHENEVKAALPDKNVFVSDFYIHDPTSSTPDLAVYSVSATRDIIVDPQCSVTAETDVVIYGNPIQAPSKALFNFCPLLQNSPASVHGTRVATIAGGGVYVGHKGPKRLQVSVTNPGGFCKIFIPKTSTLGVLEIYNHRY